jgi:ribulose-5-phosphate 4-epimerase/fuculose-1-phosphate aldolase
MELRDLREEVFQMTMTLLEKDLIRLSAGNISLHDGDGNVAITPAGQRYDRMQAADVPIVDLQGNRRHGDQHPSSETPMHTAILRSLPEVRSVVHTHSKYAIAFASTGTEVPVICLELLAVGGPVPVAPYASPGSEQAGIACVEIFQSRPSLKCVMLRNHGLVSIGASLYAAYENAYKFETGAGIYHLSLAIGDPSPLTREQIEEIWRRYRKPNGSG